MNYRIEEKPAMLLTGYKRRFTGSPNDKKDQDQTVTVTARLFPLHIPNAVNGMS